MALTNAYCTLVEFQNHVMANGGPDFTPADDGNMEIAIQAATNWLDDEFGTTFYAVTETRYFTAQFADLLYVSDLLTVTTLKVDEDEDGVYETTWATTDYRLEPVNAPGGRLPRPYRQIRTKQTTGNYSFPTGVEYGIEIAGTWGYCTAANRPAEIKQWTLLMAHRLWRRKDAIFGIAGTPALGVQVVQAKITADEDLMLLLKNISRRAAFYG